MAILPDFLRIERDGVEFFTVIATGQSGMSQRGLARACGITHPAILKLVSTLVTKAPSKWLQSFVGKGLTLVTNATKNNKEVTVYKAEFCAAAIKHYAYKGKEVAQDFDGALGSIGLTSYIQGVTGWLPQEFQSSPVARQTVDRILDKPSPWVKLYDKDFCRQVYAWFGPSFYWQFCYFYLTPVERCKVEMVNPIVNGARKYRIHQHLDADTRSRIEPYIWQLIPIVDLADGDKDKFMENYRRYFGHVEQLSFLDQLQ